MARRKVLSRKELKSQKRKEALRVEQQGSVDPNLSVSSEKTILEKKMVEIPTIVSVKELALALSIPVTKVIQELMKNGVMATINESIDYETAAIIGDDLGFEVKLKDEEKKVTAALKIDKKKLRTRPPVVTIMGHVDHGKTKLLDVIRQTDVVSTESGGITQHIGAYQVEIKKSSLEKLTKGKKVKAIPKESKSRMITFVDTPGHEAFSAMRARGANITDIVILVVAADEGVRPQTEEAIKHAQATNVPIVVALNKVDLPTADLNKTKQQLADLGLVGEEWGGKTVMVLTSAKTGEGVNQLLEMVLLLADLKELKADPTVPATGTVIESHLQAGLGPVATVLIQNGTLHLNDPVVIGETWGKVRVMENYNGKRIKEARPSTPVRIAGIEDVVEAGDQLVVVADEKVAREMTKVKTVHRVPIGIGEVSQAIKEGELTELKLIIKVDVQGSLEAIVDSLNSLQSEEVKINFIHQGVGPISESDVNLASVSGALLIAYRVPIPLPVRKLAQTLELKISSYDIIYRLLEDITAALSGLLKPEIIEERLGAMKVLGVFRTTKDEKIVGGEVQDGKIVHGNTVKILRDGAEIGQGKIKSLQQEKVAVDEVTAGHQCGLDIETTIKIKEGDILECFKIEERMRTVERA